MTPRLVRASSVLLLLCALGVLPACDDDPDFWVPAAGPQNFQASFFPVEIDDTAFPANISLIPNADLLVAGNTTDAVFAVSRVDGARRTISPLVTGGTANVLSVAANASSAFAGSSDGRLFRMPLIGGAASMILDLGTGEAITALAIAPGSFGSHGGKIVAAAAAGAGGPGRILVIDPASPAAFIELLNDPNGAFIDLCFARDGKLYLLDAAVARRQLRTLTPTGGGSVVPGTYSEPVGLAAGRTASELFVADATDDRVYAVALPAGTATAVGRFDIRGGFTPTGLAWEPMGTLMIATRGSYYVRAASYPAFDTSGLPLAIPGSSAGYGGLALDGQGDVIGTSNLNPNQVFRVDRETRAVEILASGLGVPGEDLLAVVWDPVERAIYVGSGQGQVYKVDSGGGVGTLVSLGGVKVSGLAIAPQGFGTIGGRIIASTNTGQLYHFSRTGQGVTSFGNPLPNGWVSSLVFAADGRLYAAHWDVRRVVRIAPPNSGSHVYVTADLGWPPDGLALDQLGTTLYVADAASNTLKQVPLPGGTPVTDVAIFDFDDGPEPSGMVFDGLSNLLLGVGETALQLSHHPLAP